MAYKIRKLITSEGSLVHSVDIAALIREDISDGVIEFGQPLRIGQLASKYSVSVMPVREALRQLSGEGFIVLEPNRTAKVRTLDTAYFQQIFELRMAVEIVLARGAAKNWRTSDTELVLRTHDLLEDAVKNHDFPFVLDLNRDFHRQVYSRAEHIEAYKTMDKYWLLQNAFAKRFGYNEQRFSGVVNDHWHIIKALKAGDQDAVKIIVGAHLIKAKHFVLENLRNESKKGSQCT
tara:strand:+ start:78 stop:779 length:702 start_codon:yes stop_codon:yes gene_type:complete